jgi:hypothetical protein
VKTEVNVVENFLLFDKIDLKDCLRQSSKICLKKLLAKIRQQQFAIFSTNIYNYVMCVKEIYRFKKN